jgi:unsaturated rhamnogalacturonyl hydrolase
MRLPKTCFAPIGNDSYCPAPQFRVLLLVFVALCALPCRPQTKPWSELAAHTLIDGRQAATLSSPWNDETGLELEGLDAAWYNTANGDDFRDIRTSVDAELAVSSTDANQPPLDALLASQLLLLYRVTLDAKYYQAAAELHERLVRSCGLVPEDSLPRNPGGPVAPSRCTAQPFLAEYAAKFQQPQDFAGITRSFIEWYEGIRTNHTTAEAGDPSTRELASLALAMVDALPAYPPNNSDRVRLVALFSRVADEVARRQDSRSGLFDDSASGKAKPASTASQCLLVYALDKGVRLGYLPRHDADSAQRAWQSILSLATQVQNDGTLKLDPFPRPTPPDTPIGHDSPLPHPNPHAERSERGLGQFLLAATEAEQATTAALASGQVITVDAWYNSQQRKNAAGQMESFHYKWSDMSDSGYSLFGHMFRNYGMTTETLRSAPTLSKLAKSQFYLIVSPDIPVKNPNPHYMTANDATQIAAWVRRGGVLILMENDPPNADIDHLNLLADKFGIHFDNVLHHHILGEQVEDGRIPVAPGGLLFHQAHTLYMKDTCAISLHGAATPLLQDRGDVVMATAKYGRGTVFAAVDPWVYNEYTDGRKNPRIYNQFDNFAGGKELVQWLLQQHPR